MPPRLSNASSSYSKLPKPKTPSLNRSPQHPHTGARRQTNNYITPLPKPLSQNIVPSSHKDLSRRSRYQGEPNRPGQAPAKPRHQPPNLRVPPAPAADSTSYLASGFESPRMTELREQYNQTPSPERLPSRPAAVRFAAIAEYASPLESKQQYQRQQQHLRSRIPVQATATDPLSPRKLFGSRDAAKSQPLIQSNHGMLGVTTARDIGRDKKEANSSPVMVSSEALMPMYFTMQYKNNRSQTALGPDGDTPLQGLGLAVVQDHDIHDGYKRRVSLRFERPEGNVETRYAQVSKPRVLEKNKPIQGEDLVYAVAQQSHHGQEATLGPHVEAQGWLLEGQPSPQDEKTGSTTNQQLQSKRQRSKPCSPGATSEGSLLEQQYTYPRYVESKYNSQTATESIITIPGKQASKSLGYLGNLSIRNFSWGNNLPKDTNRKEAGATTQAAGKLEEKRGFTKGAGAVLDRVRKFEALGSKDVQQPTPNHHPLTSSDLGPGSTPSGPVVKKWYTTSKSNLRQYFQGKGKEPSSEEIAPLNPRVHTLPGLGTTQRRQSCGTEHSSIYNSDNFIEAVSNRVLGPTENLKLPASKGYQKPSPETYKYQNPDGGRFPPWPKKNGLEVTKRSPVTMGGTSMIDARRRETDMSLLPLPTEARPGQQSIMGSLRSDAPQHIGSHVNSINPDSESSERRCSMAYWAGRYSTMRDTIRQEILAMEDPAESRMVCLDDWHRDFVEAVFQRLLDSTKEHCPTPSGGDYREKQVAYLREYQKDTMKIVAIKTRKYFFGPHRDGDD